MKLITNWQRTVSENWRTASSEDESFKLVFVINIIISAVIYLSIVQWLRYNSCRHGAIIDDPAYNLLAPRDFSHIIFAFTYSSVVLFILYIVQYPLLMHRAFTAFVTVFFVRALCIYFIPLSPSPTIIELRDPFISYASLQTSILNDLFFSGHVADIALFAIMARDQALKRFFIFAGVTIALLLVWQRVHYTLDVVAAPFFSYFCVWLIVEKDIIWSAYIKKPILEQKWEQ